MLLYAVLLTNITISTQSGNRDNAPLATLV